MFLAALSSPKAHAIALQTCIGRGAMKRLTSHATFIVRGHEVLVLNRENYLTIFA